MEIFFTVVIILMIIVALFFIITGFFPFTEIVGSSMFPTLEEGQVCLAMRIHPKDLEYFNTQIGNIFIYNPPGNYLEKHKVIKRLVFIEDDKLFFYGDNALTSYDSRDYGGVEPKEVIFKLIWYRKNGV